VPKAERETRLVAWLDKFEATTPLGIGYTFYDEEDGELCVLQNDNFNAHYAEVVDNLGGLL
tara:strand:+ start:741 stop:923 length:183 start_codon:yes stop_codon:yes gene_type:complete